MECRVSHSFLATDLEPVKLDRTSQANRKISKGNDIWYSYNGFDFL